MSVRGLQNRMFCLARYPLSRISSRYYIVTTEQVRRVNLLATINSERVVRAISILQSQVLAEITTPSAIKRM